MKIYSAIIAFITLTAAVVADTDSATKSTEYQLPDGRVLKNPIVLEKEPNGLSVGHDRGITFVKFADLPADIQKRYNYDPETAQQYEKKQKAAQQARTARQAEEKRTAAHTDESRNQTLAAAKARAQENEITKLELRLKFLDEEIPKLEKAGNTYLDKITTINTSPSNAYSSTSNNIYWRGGFISNSGSEAMRKDANTRAKIAKDLTSQMKNNKIQLEKYKTEYQQKTLQLNTLRQQQNKPADK